MRSSIRLSILSSVFLLGAACAPNATLTPAPAAERAAGAGVVDSAAGVQVTAKVNAWEGVFPVSQRVTPVHVTIENNGDRPLRIRYDDFTLASQDGTRYAVIPPYGFDEAVGRLVPSPTLGVVANPMFVQDAFYLAPPYGPIYPGLPAYGEAFPYDPFYYKRYHQHWAATAMPTEEMLNRALPEGVLEKGGRLSGFLYFEQIQADDERVSFRANLVGARTGDQFGQISIPFLVKQADL